jgi:hypothetical protein
MPNPEQILILAVLLALACTIFGLLMTDKPPKK